VARFAGAEEADATDVRKIKGELHDLRANDADLARCGRHVLHPLEVVSSVQTIARSGVRARRSSTYDVRLLLAILGQGLLVVRETQAEVARIAGVSQAMVSRVLNGSESGLS